MKTHKKFAAAGITGAMLLGAGAGVILNLPAGAGAASAPAVTAPPTTDPTSASTVTSDATTSDATTSDATGADAADTGGRGEFLKTQLDALVVAGTITQAQEDAILAGVESARPAAGAAGDHAGRGPGKGGPGMGGRGFGFGGGIDAAATALGVTTDELKTELEAGKTVADVATDKGVDVQTVIDAIVAAQTSELTQRVTDAVNGVKPTPPAAAADGSTGADDTTSTTTG